MTEKVIIKENYVVSPMELILSWQSSLGGLGEIRERENFEKGS